MNARSRLRWCQLVGAAMAVFVAGCASGRFDAVGDDSAPYYSPSEVDTKPVLVSQVLPVYPVQLRGRRLDTTVFVTFFVDEHGEVRAAKAEPSQERWPRDWTFEEAAVRAVAQWRFRPGIKDGVPVRVAWRVPVIFKTPAQWRAIVPL